jgi:translation initiation factor 1
MKQKTNKDARLVYSSDGSHLRLCKKCGEDPCECKDIPKNFISIDPTKITLKIKLEKNQRGGKLVTVIHDLPYNPPYFTELTKKLKNSLGTGGAFKDQIELQGDHRDKAEVFLAKMGFKTKRSGG